MDYELKKELKKAGFRVPVGASPLWQPTLSELIEACGDRFYGLDKYSKNTWRSFSSPTQMDMMVSEKGSTPEEAVARLWLALHPN